MNERHRTQLKNQIELLADSHYDLVNRASNLNARIIQTNEEKNEDKKLTQAHWVDRDFTILVKLLGAHRDRVARVRAEIAEIQRNITF